MLLCSVPALTQFSLMSGNNEQEGGNPQLGISEIFKPRLHALFRQKITSVLYATAKSRCEQNHLHKRFLEILFQLQH